jgi:TolB protein
MDKSKTILNRIPGLFWLVLITINLILLIVVVTRLLNKNLSQKPVSSQNTQDITITSSPTFTPTKLSSPTESPTVLLTQTPNTGTDSNFPIFFLSIMLDGKSHIYVYNPGLLQFTRLFGGDYEEINPSISPDRQKLAYSAKKNGYWDIYVYNIETTEETRITDTPEFDGYPTWSPDSQFIAYESYKFRNLDIFIKSLNDLEQIPIQLTTSLTQDFSPSWSPTGRDIAFVSTTSGEEEIWLASLDDLENRFTLVSNHPSQPDVNPSWSSDGSILTWSSQKDGFPVIYKKEVRTSNQKTSIISEGNAPFWFENLIYFIQGEANQFFLTAREAENGNQIIPSIRIPGQVFGSSITRLSNTKIFFNSIQDNDKVSVNYLENNSQENIINSLNRAYLEPLENVEAPYPYLSSAIIASFENLREITTQTIGWDFLHSLNHVFTPITEPIVPGKSEEWLFTGRAFEFNPLILYADLAVISREERNGQTYWRVFLKTRYQDGSQGMPIKQMPWQLELRYDNDPSIYESGGERVSIPEGYYIDFTALAMSLGWERLPALANWRSFFDSARFNQFVLPEQLDWESAMLEIYPAEALYSPTPLPSVTTTPTLTPTIRYFRSPTSTITPDYSKATLRPTWTPVP